MTTTATLALFGDETDPTPVPPPTATEQPDRIRALRPAPARLIAAHDGDPHHADHRPKLYLVVTCPYCDHQHIHTAGHVGEPRLCPRNARCVGTPGGSYYFPAVDQ